MLGAYGDGLLRNRLLKYRAAQNNHRYNDYCSCHNFDF